MLLLVSCRSEMKEHQQVRMAYCGLFVPLIFYFILDVNKGCQAEMLQQVFRVEPENITILEGETALLKCEVENASGTVQWVKDGLLLGPNWSIPRFPRYSMMGETSKGIYNLQIIKSQLEDDAFYECQVGPTEKSTGIISHRVQLTVLVPPKQPLFVEYEANSVVTWIAGTEYTLHCQVKDARPPAEITFCKADKELADVTSTIQPGSEAKLFSTEALLRFTPESSDNKELLTCKAANTVTLIPVVVSFSMNILFPPQLPVIKGYTGAVVKNKELKLTCISPSGNPLATLQWLKNNEVISRNWETDDTSQLSRSSLNLKITPEDNMAVVSCQALNQVLSLPLQSSIVLKVTFPPEQVKITGSSSTEENQEIFLTCSTSTSNPPVMLRWLLGWRELNATETAISEAEYGGMVTVSNLTYIAYREDNGLPLICEAFNEAIMYTKSASVTLRVTYPPQKIWLNVPPPETYFRAGVEIKLVCFASGGNPLPRLDWYKVTCTLAGGVRVQLQQSQQSGHSKPCQGKQDIKLVREGTSTASSGNIISKELVLTTTPSDNMANYRCNATGSPSTLALTAYTSLLVQFPPLHATITATDKKVRRGQSVTLTCKSGSSNPPAHLTWLKDGKRLDGINLGQRKAEYGGFSASERVTLVVSSADHGKRVECYAYSSVLSEGVNTFYQLTVLFPPEFSPEQTHLVQAVEHESARLPLLVSASPPEITYRWSFLGEVILTDGSPRYHLRDGGSLEIWNVTRADAGKYRIHCENAEGQNETTITLNVHYSPSIRSIADPTYVDLGDTAEIVCQADANPIPNFQWRWLGDLERSLEDLGFKVLSEGLVGTLRVEGAQRTHAGLYECQVDNGISPAAKSSARLIVRYPPEIIKGPGQNKVAASGDGRSQAVLQCSAQGVPSVLFSWAKNGVSLDLQSPRYSVVTSYEDSLHTSTLTIANVSAMLDYAIFTCTANNDLGTDVFDIQLLSTSRPDPPTEFKVVSVAHNWLALEWIPGFDGGLQQSFRVRYHWPGAPSFLYVDVFPPQSPTFTLTGLQPSTLYNVSVNARNALGESDFADGGAGLSITTEERIEIPVDKEPEIPFSSESEGSILPLPIVVLLGGLGGFLLVSNLFLLGCLVFRKRTQTPKGDGIERSTRGKVRFGNSYAVSKWLKVGGQPAPLEGYSSEGSSTKTSAAVSTATNDTSVTDPNISLPWIGSQEHHEYEEVGGPKRLEDMGPLYGEWNTNDEPWINEYAHVYQGFGRWPAASTKTAPIYDSVANYYLPLDTELPFEQQGELV
ncbi:nephrin [Pantherophis guttatus]|uniref:Nephrin n=1 Tax=Pantherophis guttatus TaxID=94885 RepID=A0A6P9CKA1_PANGU|nr:nephrin [Pantherophis guttatus]